MVCGIFESIGFIFFLVYDKRGADFEFVQYFFHLGEISYGLKPYLFKSGCQTRGSHLAVAGRLGKGLAGKSATQRANQIAAGGFPSADAGYRAIKLTPSFCGRLNQ